MSMMLSLPRLALLGALLLVYSATAQLPIPEGRCVTFEEDSAPLSQCQAVIPAGTKVFITLNSSLAAVDAEVATFTAPFRLALTTRECSDAAMRLFCAQAFPNCQEQALPTGVTLILPQLPCLTRCETFNEECGAFLESIGRPLTDCSVQVAPGIPQYPLQGLNIPLAPGFSIQVPCFSPGIVQPYPEIPRATCQPVEATPNSLCKNLVGYDIYVPEGLSVSEIDAIAGEQNGLFRIGLVNEDCMNEGMRLICAQAFRRCVYVEVDPALPKVLLPGATCKKRCEEMLDECADQFNDKGVGVLLPDCDEINPTSGQPEYPDGAQIIQIGSDRWQTACNNLPLGEPWPYVPLATCQRYKRPDKSPCDDVVSERPRQSTVYVPDGQDQGDLDEIAWDSLRSLLYGVVPKKCSDAALRFVCSSAFRPCVTETVPQSLLPPGAETLTLALPAAPCYDMCREFVSECRQTIETAGNDVPDCDADNTVSQAPEYPFLQSTVILPWNTVVQECIDEPEETDSDQYCPGDFEENFDDEDDDDGRCKLPCPIPIYSDGEYLAMKILATIFSILSFITSIFLIITFGLDKKKRKFPANMPLWIAFAALGFSIAYLFGVFTWFDYVICDNDGLCKTQAVFFLYFQYALACWMLILAFNIFITVAVKFKRVALLQIPYHIFCWTAGIAPFIVGLAIDRMEYAVPSIICFVGGDPDGWPIIGLYTIPIGVIVILTCICVLLIVWRIYKVSRELEASFFQSLLEQWRIFLFIAVFLYIFVYNIEESIRASVNYNTNVDGIQDWAECVFEKGDDEDCEFDTELYYPLSLLFIINTSLQGFLVNVIFLTSPSTFSFWYHRMKNLLTGKGFYGDEYDLEGTVAKKHSRSRRASSKGSRSAQMSDGSMSLPGDDDFDEEDL